LGKPFPAFFFQGIDYVHRLLCQPEIHNDLFHRITTRCMSGGLSSQVLKRSMKRPVIFQRNKAKYEAMTSSSMPNFIISMQPDKAEARARQSLSGDL